MKKAIFIFLILTAAVPLGFIAWMNLTPGYFQVSACYCGVEYLTDDQASRQNLQCHLVDCQPPSTIKSWLWRLELNLAKLDFNRGPKSSWSTNQPFVYKDYQGKFFSFSYPSTWKFSSPDDSYVYVGENRPGVNSFTLRFREAKEFDRVIDVVDRIKSYDIFSTAGWGDAAPQEIKRESIMLAGRPATKFTYKLNNLKNSPTLTSNHLVWIASLSDEGLLTAEIYGDDEKTLNQILLSLTPASSKCSKVPPTTDILCVQGYRGCYAADGSCKLTCCQDN